MSSYRRPAGVSAPGGPGHVGLRVAKRPAATAMTSTPSTYAMGTMLDPFYPNRPAIWTPGEVTRRQRLFDHDLQQACHEGLSRMP